MLRRTLVAAAAGCLLLGLGGPGCANTDLGFDPVRLSQARWPSPSPAPDSPAGALRRLEWCYNTKSLAPCRELFTDDFHWLCSPLDSAGAAWRDTPWTREDELISTTHLFIGGSVEPPASSIRLTFDRNLLVDPDPSLRDPAGDWHQAIRTTVFLYISTEDGNSLEIRGHATFYFVRGDSALIPDDLRRRGFGPDPGRWYIRRWDDETFQDGGGAQGAAAVTTRHAALGPQPTAPATWCRLKAAYR